MIYSFRIFFLHIFFLIIAKQKIYVIIPFVCLDAGLSGSDMVKVMKLMKCRGKTYFWSPVSRCFRRLLLAFLIFPRSLRMRTLSSYSSLLCSPKNKTYSINIWVSLDSAVCIQMFSHDVGMTSLTDASLTERNRGIAFSTKPNLVEGTLFLTWINQQVLYK